MKFEKIEYHSVHSHLYFDIPDEDIIKEFGSLERFKQILSHIECEDSYDEPEGEPPTEEEYDKFYEVESWYGHVDREDDWFSERKGGYEVSYKSLED